MSRMHEAHYEIARVARWLAKNLGTVHADVDAPVRRWHRQDRYREIEISSNRAGDLREILAQLEQHEVWQRHANRANVSTLWSDLPQGGRRCTVMIRS